MQFNILHTSEGKAVFVIVNDSGEPSMVTHEHPHYARIGNAIVNGEDVTPYLDGTFVDEHVPSIENLSSRVSIVDGVLHFDGDAVYNGLASTIERYRTERREATNLVRLMERLSANPSANSREQLFKWTQAMDLTIDHEGYIVSYKGVSARTSDQDYLGDDGLPLFPLDKYPYQSATAGPGIVDGIEINGHHPFGVGAVIEMPRVDVADDPRVGCSTGLHVGTYDYAVGYSRSGALLEVRFDPADVVSVPNDCGWAKLRCCRYEAVAIHDLDLGDDLSDWEPDAAEDEAMEAFVMNIPEGWGARIKNRLRRKNKGGDES